MVKHNNEDDCPICPKHSGIETWVKIGMAGIATNIMLLVVNILLNFSLNASIASIQTTLEAQEKRIATLERIHERKP